MVNGDSAETRSERVAAGEVRVDLRESLGSGTELPGLDRAGPDSSGMELFPADVYRIVDGREVRDTPWSRLVGRARSALTSPPR